MGIRDVAEIAQAEQYLLRVSRACIGELRRTHTERAQTGARFTCSYEFRRGDRSVIWVEDRGRFVCSPDGEPIRILGTIRCLDLSLRASDVVGRVAHDQFGIVLSGCATQDVPAAGEKLLLAVQQSTVMTDKGHIPITASVGAVSFPDAVRTSYDAMAKADIALEKARRSGTRAFSSISSPSSGRKTSSPNIMSACCACSMKQGLCSRPENSCRSPRKWA